MTKRKTPFFFTFKGLSNSPIFHTSIFHFIGTLRTFALIVCAQPFYAGNATVISHATLRLTGPEDKNGVENAGGKISGRVYSFGSSVILIFLIMNHLLYLLSTKYDKMKKISS